MDEKDIIARFSGKNSKVKEALDEIIEQAVELGLIGEDLSINKVPKKVEKSKLQNKSASDIMVNVSGDESKIEAFMEEVITLVSENIGIDTPSTGVKLLQGNNDDKG
jgi:2-phosphoglycerate kinase